jgi:hypothetical protein
VGPGRPAKIQELIPKNPENITGKTRKYYQKNTENIAINPQKISP